MSKISFFPAIGVNFAQFTEIKPKFTENPLSTFTRAQKEGLRYEKKVHKYLEKLVLDDQSGKTHIKISPWIMFKTSGDASGKVRFCQPDCVIFSETFSRIIIIEIKYQHTNQAQKQLRKLYEPVIRFLYPHSNIACLEICRWFDPHALFEEHFYYAENPLLATPNALGVHIYNPQRKLPSQLSQ